MFFPPPPGNFFNHGSNGRVDEVKFRVNPLENLINLFNPLEISHKLFLYTGNFSNFDLTPGKSNTWRTMLTCLTPWKIISILQEPWKFCHHPLEISIKIPPGKVRPPLCMDIKWNGPIVLNKISDRTY